MHLRFRGVNDAFQSIVSGIRFGTIETTRTTSRVGDVLQIQEPVTITYAHPKERVLLNEARDANPFFHLYESLWMLAGRNDVKPLLFYNGNISDVASDDGETFNGAYGYRWRSASIDEMADGGKGQRIDQLNRLVDHLKKTPDSRRAVLAMWNVENDLLRIDDTKDCCCNLSACFAIRTVNDVTSNEFDMVPAAKYLDMTVFNRSNDLVWGSLGANVVHFSYLQEYIACCLGVDVGLYHQVSNNLHVYVSNWHPDEWLASLPMEYPYSGTAVPLVRDQGSFDVQCNRFVDAFSGPNSIKEAYTEPFFEYVAKPMCLAFAAHKERNYDLALEELTNVVSDDWRVAGVQWVARRYRAWRKRKNKDTNPYLVQAMKRLEAEEIVNNRQ